MGRRAKRGDVLELATAQGRLYLHYLGRHPEYGDGIIVCPTHYSNPTTLTSDLFLAGYFIFYPAATAVSQGLAHVVGNLPPPALPKRFRRPGARGAHGITSWILEDGSDEVVKYRLSEEERQLPIAVIWNHAMLLHRVSEGWRPETES